MIKLLNDNNKLLSVAITALGNNPKREVVTKSLQAMINRNNKEIERLKKQASDEATKIQ